MFLYELAIELDMRSTELADGAARLGMGEVGPTTDLSAEQVTALRAGCRRAQPDPAPPAAGSGAALTAPANWGHAASRELLHDASPSSASSPAPSPQFTPPPPPPPPGSWPSAPVPPPPTGSTWRESRGQLAAIGVVVVLVAGLFAYMAMNSGPDRERKEQLRADDRRAEALPTATLAPTTTSSTVPEGITILPGSAEDPEYHFVDLGRFCGGARGVTAFELRISAGAVEDDWSQVRRALLDGRTAWRVAVDDLAGGTAPYLASDIDRYRTSYEALIDGAQNASAPDAIQRVFTEGYSFGLRRSAKKVNAAIYSNCGSG